ncbi:MAG: BamA/TamA family outer membrane protein [Rikenellaceae bacterium]
MNRYLLIALISIFVCSYTFAQVVDNNDLQQQQEQQYDKRYERQMRRDSIRAGKKVWISVLGGPSYTPEASFGVGGAMLASFKINSEDTVSYRSFLPIGFNISLNNTLVIAGAGTLFINENKFRIYSSYGYRNEPAHYYGKGFESIESNYRSDTTTLYNREYIQFYPRFVWEVKKSLYLGVLFELNYSKNSDINSVMAQDDYFNKFSSKYKNIGVGGIIQYDTRDDVATPNSGVYLSATSKMFGHYIGGDYNYQILDLEYRQFQPLFKRALIGWTTRAQIGFNDVPFSELPTFGSPFDLRGYYLGQYRDKSMAYGIAEYRQMFGTEEDLAQGRLLSKFGYVAWIGTGTLGDTPKEWDRWKMNYGAGIRIQIQPRKNFRVDIGKVPGVKGVQFYMNMTEAF